jgi:hypothetical protein
LISLVLFAGGAALNALAPPRPRVDFGEWRAVVVHSDDWGFEGWFPTSMTDSLRAALSVGVPDWQSAYLESTLESADEVRELADWFAGFRDLDGFPFVLQANTIVAGPSIRETGSGDSWPVHASGTGPDYDRPGLDESVDRAVDLGVWWPELHGLTHYDLVAYARARESGDALARAAARQGAFAYDGYRGDFELGDDDPTRAREIADESVRRFVVRFGRRPTSVIAPDYRWGAEDESAWASLGLRVVQAKREQVDPALAPHTLMGRVRKRVGRWRFARAGALMAVERTVDLEPYGDPDPDAPQGAGGAHRELEAAFERGETGVLSIHRVQLVSRSTAIAAAGRAQLAELLGLLERSGGARFLVDAEVEQLSRRGWSVLSRGERTWWRNWTDQPVLVEGPDGRRKVLAPRTSAVSGNFLAPHKESHK